MNRYNTAFLCASIAFCSPQLAAQQCDILTAQSPSFDDLYGHEVVQGGGQLFVTAPYEDDDLLGVDSGAVYVYEIVDHELRLVQHIQPPEPSRADWFGSAVAVDGDTLVIGASGDDDNARASGSVFVYRRAGDEWKFDHKQTAHDGGFNDGFGTEVRLDGGLLAVASPGFDGVASSSGKVYIYNISTRLLLHEIVGDDTSTRDAFGYVMAMGDGHLFVGVPAWDLEGADTTGAVYVFDTQSGVQLARLTSGQEHANQAFGRALAYESGHLLVGAPGQNRVYDDGQYDGRIGAVYHYVRGAGAFELIDIVQPDDVVQHDEFGRGIAIDQGLAVISSPSCTSYCTTTGAKVYVYNLNSRSLVEKYVPEGPFFGAAMGRQVELFDEFIVAASELANSPAAMFGDAPSGAGVIFDRRLYNCPANRNEDCVVNADDIEAFQTAFATMSPLGDLNDDGRFDFYDVSLFIKSYIDGCV